MGRRRSRTELVCEVLESIDSGIHKPTHILYNTKVSWNVYSEIIELLQSKKFIKTIQSDETENQNRVKYYLTTDGREALQGMKFLKEVFTPA
jgi:predicted transcriptional regulator